MNCKKCGTSVFEKPLNRVNPIGEIAVWWCSDCIKKEEPELYDNIKEEETEIEKHLKDIFYK